MIDTAFVVPPTERHRLTSYYHPRPGGGFTLADAPDGQWSSEPAFAAGSGGLAGTIDDWLRFGRMLLGEGILDGRQVLTPASVRMMTTNHLPPPSATSASCSSKGRAGGSAERSTSSRSSRGRCRAVTAGSAAPAPARTSPRPLARSRSCSRRSAS